MADGYEHIVFPATTSGKNVAPRLAALLDVMVISDITGVVGPDTFERPIYAGNAIQTVQSSDPKKVVTVRGASFAATGEQAPAPIETAPRRRRSRRSRPGSRTRSRPPTGPSSPRRGSSSPAAAASARRRTSRSSRSSPTSSAPPSAPAAPRSTRGYAPNDWQVGQTGKVVAPELYIAVGISGAIQHLAGMKDSKVIVAINKDEEAPIFQVADYGLVGDLFQIVPELEKKL